MKVNDFKKFRKEDFQDAPEWFQKFLVILNDTLESNTTTLKKLDLNNNFLSEEREITLENDKELTLTHKLNGQVKRVLVDFADNTTILGQSWGIVTPTSIKIKLKMDKPSAKVRITIML